MTIQVNGQHVVFSLQLVTEPGEGWKGIQFIGTYKTLGELNNAIRNVEVPLYWMLEIDFQDADDE